MRNWWKKLHGRSWGSVMISGHGDISQHKKYSWLSFWWYQLTDRELRYARKQRRRINKGELQMHTIGTTDNGIEIQVPETELVNWSLMPEEAKQAFMDKIAGLAQEGKNDE